MSERQVYLNMLCLLLLSSCVRSLRLVGFTVLFRSHVFLPVHYCVEVSCISKCAITPLELSYFHFVKFCLFTWVYFVFVKMGLM